MLTQYFKSSRTLERYRNGLVGPYVDEFVSWLEGRGYRRRSIRRYLPGAHHLSLWAQRTGITLPELNRQALEGFDASLHAHPSLKHPGPYCTQLFRGARHVITFLEATNRVVPSARLSLTVSDPELLVAFRHWMRTHRGTTEATVTIYRPTLIALLQTLGEEPERFTAQALRAFILDCASRHGTERTKTDVRAVRMFLRFLIAMGRCRPDLDQAIPSIVRWRLATLPKYLSAEEVERTIASCDLSRVIGVRDRAVLLLLSRLGLRAGEVASLKLTDLDWSAGTVQVAGKNRRAHRLPLCQEVGDALLAYLQQRPGVTCDQVFVSTIAPIKALSYQAVSKIAKSAFHRAGVAAPMQGAHVLRHSAATEMLRQGLSLTTIGMVLRHVDIETTAGYAKVDVQLLQQVARPWPEDLTC